MKAEDPKAVFQAMRPVFSDLVAEIQRSLGFFASNNRDVQLGEVILLGNAVKLPGLQLYLSQNLDQKVTPVDEFANLVGGSVAATQQFTENRLTFPVAYGLCVQALGRSQAFFTKITLGAVGIVLTGDLNAVGQGLIECTSISLSLIHI